MKKGLFILIISVMLVLCACGSSYSAEFQKIYDSYIQDWEMWDDSMVELEMYYIAENYAAACNATDLNTMPDQFAEAAAYPLATMSGSSKAAGVGRAAWDAIYMLYQNDMDAFKKNMDAVRSKFEEAVGMSIEDYLASTSEQDIYNTYKVPH